MTDSDTHDTLPGELQHPAADAVSPGTRLAAEREANGWTIEQVAAYLKLAPRQVLAIEKDDFDALPGMPIARGFVRSYAKLLKIDAAPLLEQMGGAPGRAQHSLRPKEDLAAPFSEARLPSMSEKSAISSKWLIGILLVALLGVAIWAFRNDTPLATQSAPASESSDAPVEPAGGEASDNAPPPVQEELSLPFQPTDEVSPPAPDAPDAADSGDGGAAPPQQTESVPASSVDAPSPAAVTEPAATSAPQSATTSKTPEAVGADVLILAVREESWIEVRRGAGSSPVVARLAQPGENISIRMDEPVELVVGNAAGVDARLRGKPVALQGNARSNVARLTLK